MKKIHFTIFLVIISIVCSDRIQAQEFIANSTVVEGLNTFSTADFNNDGLPDIVGLNSKLNGSKEIELLLNTSNSSIGFESFPLLTTPLLNGKPSAGDIDGDGDIDIVFSEDMAQNIKLLVNSGDNNSFIISSTDFAGVNNLNLADLEGDGDLDIIGYTFDDNIITTFINNGSGTFEEGITIEHDNDISSLDYGDIDNDGDIDFAISIDKFSGETIAVYLNDNLNNFTKLSSFDVNALNSAIQVKLIDLNNDGKMDVLGLNDKKLTAFLQNDIFGFLDQDIISPSNEGDLSVFDVADFDNDGDMDIVIGDLSADLHWYKNQSLLFNQIQISDMMPILSLQAEDFDDDGDIDFVVSNGDFRAYRNDIISSTLSLLPQNEIDIFPNPAAEYFELIANSEGTYNVTLFNAQGQTIRSETFTNSKVITIQDLPNGVYTIQVLDTVKQAFLIKKMTKI